MHNSIVVSYPPDTSGQIRVFYTIEISENIQTINCKVDGGYSPIWLQLRKFSMLSEKNKGIYTPLFNEINSSKNMDTSLFIDLVYTHIMGQEHLKVIS